MPDSEASRLRWLLAFASLLLAAGLYAPMLTISQLLIVNNTFSVLSGTIELWRNGQILLFLLIFGFSILLPVMKIILLFLLLGKRLPPSGRTRRYLHLMHDYGRWSMLDVLVVAILVVAVKLGAIASVTIHAGLYLFGGAVLSIMYVTYRVVRLTA
ncbi:MAG: paraquat-inducible protein A [Gammaproteobacteria bacterium]|nr:paraquat-inducible protein A [Gammaproteobacteria bacterium]